MKFVDSNPRVVYASDRSKAVVPVLFLFYVALWFILKDASCLVLSCSLILCFFSPFRIVITSLGEEGTGLCASRVFVYFARVIFVLFLFLLVSGVCCDFWLWHSLDFSINCLSKTHLTDLTVAVESLMKDEQTL